MIWLETGGTILWWIHFFPDRSVPEGGAEELLFSHDFYAIGSQRDLFYTFQLLQHEALLLFFIRVRQNSNKAGIWSQ